MEENNISDNITENNDQNLIGPLLKAARLQKGDTLEQASESLHIKIKYLAALEEDQFAEYHADVRRGLRNEAQYMKYLAGDWDDEILDAVMAAQQKHMKPRRQKTKIQQKPRATHKPKPGYQGT